jgi:hypothetical protein
MDDFAANTNAHGDVAVPSSALPWIVRALFGSIRVEEGLTVMPD